MRSLVVGRFQPLQLGHLKMIEYVAQRSSYLTIGIGSCNSESSKQNPFTAEEREDMLRQSLTIETPYEFRRIPDFGDGVKWVSWIRQNITFDVFYTNSANERGIFESAGLKVEEIPFFERERYSATEVRKRILEGGNWAELMPHGAVKVMSSIDGEHRMRKTSG